MCVCCAPGCCGSSTQPAKLTRFRGRLVASACFAMPCGRLTVRLADASWLPAFACLRAFAFSRLALAASEARAAFTSIYEPARIRRVVLQRENESY